MRLAVEDAVVVDDDEVFQEVLVVFHDPLP